MIPQLSTDDRNSWISAQWFLSWVRTIKFPKYQKRCFLSWVRTIEVPKYQQRWFLRWVRTIEVPKYQQRWFLSWVRTTKVPKYQQRRLTSRITDAEAPKFPLLNKDQPSLAESSSTTGIQALAKESLMRTTLLRVTPLSPSLVKQFPNGINKPIPDITRQLPLHASANFWAL